MLKPDTYSIENYREADRIVEEYNHLLQRSSKVFDQLSTQYKSAYYQLVHSPIALSANLNQMYVAAGKNRYYGVLGTAAANYYAKEVERLFQRDAELTRDYHEMEDGKWNHMMSQTHIGYTYWNHPPLNLMPAVSRVQLAEPAELGYFLEYGDRPRWGWLDVEADWSFSTSLPEFDPVNDQSYYIDVVNRGQEELNYQLSAENDWIQLSKTSGTTQYHEMVYVSIDWEKVPDGTTEGEITISGAGNFYTVIVPLRKEIPAVSGFVENNGVIAFDAAHYTRKVDSKEARWTEVPNLGRTGSAMMLSPVTARIEVPGKNSPQLEYDFSVFDASELLVAAYLSPTQDFKKQGGLRYAIAIDDEEPQIININEGEIKPDWEYAEWWSKSVGDHIKIKQSSHSMVSPGKHTLKVWAIDPGVVFQKVVINAGGEKDSYLGPPESKYVQP